MQSCMNVLHTYMEGIVSQIFYLLGPSLNFMKSRKICLEKKRFPVF